ncbi:mitochondrial carrier domain-containing protein [Polychytrium aggregatum]|uniref:mitochondrial carrier domain-containing protein n=1 Tax=Polychytrium aggregatum TaxID=110093 RepID=UPI0022FF2DC8|nr:mitochondrial carrier domain-containing protein [Polychytrium aggregatum]KAI9205806.1 mitochondrial carrier domain-containing protein [Polychytrium aggregatum]
MSSPQVSLPVAPPGIYENLPQHTPVSKPKGKISLTTKLVCGAIAGVIGTSIIFPLDIVKTRLQNQRPGPDGLPQYRGAVDCFKQIVRKEGVRGLYRGLLPNLIGICPEKAIKLAVNDAVREHFAEQLQIDADHIPVHYGIVAGATAGFCQVIATNPMEMVKIQMQLAGANTAPGLPKPSAGDIVRQLGLRGLYKGTAACLARDVPFSIVFFPTLAVLKSLGSGPSGTPSFGVVFGSGIAAGMIAAAAVTPMDVVKTRLQAIPRPGDPVYKGMAHCYREIIKNEGFSALFRGVVPRMLIVSPLFAITVLVYEVQQRFLSGAKVAAPATISHSSQSMLLPRKD